jgi:D-3-phosphoglycerate dehydrogenase
LEKNKAIVARVERAAIASPLSDEAEVIQKAGIELMDIDAVSEDEIIAKAREADVVFTVRAAFTRRIFENLPKLRAVVRCGIGFDNIDVDAATDNHVLVVNIPDFCFEEVSNHAIVLLMACAKKLVRMNHLLKTAGTHGLHLGADRRHRRLRQHRPHDRPKSAVLRSEGDRL